MVSVGKSGSTDRAARAAPTNHPPIAWLSQMVEPVAEQQHVERLPRYRRRDLAVQKFWVGTEREA